MVATHTPLAKESTVASHSSTASSAPTRMRPPSAVGPDLLKGRVQEGDPLFPSQPGWVRSHRISIDAARLAGTRWAYAHDHHVWVGAICALTGTGKTWARTCVARKLSSLKAPRRVPPRVRQRQRRGATHGARGLLASGGSPGSSGCGQQSGAPADPGCR